MRYKFRKQLETDFVVNGGDERYYEQSARSIADSERIEQEIASLIRIPDSVKKIVVVKDYIKPWGDENGIQYIGVEDFLLDESLIAQCKHRVILATKHRIKMTNNHRINLTNQKRIVAKGNSCQGEFIALKYLIAKKNRDVKEN